MEPRAVVERLKEFGKRRADQDRSRLDSQTRSLIRGNPFAFLIAVAFDRGMPWQTAWQIPVEIDRKGCLDPALLASMTKTDLIALLDGLAVRPRWGTGEGARTLGDAARLVSEQFGGNAGAIWATRPPREVEKTLRKIHGIGAGIASMTIRILHDDCDCDYFRGQESQIDVKPDVHVVRVFRRSGLIDRDSQKQAILAARRLNPEFPGELDWPAWRIGQCWCHKSNPDCTRCPLSEVCEMNL